MSDRKRTNTDQAIVRLRNEVALHRSDGDRYTGQFTEDIECVCDEVERLRDEVKWLRKERTSHLLGDGRE